MAVPDEKFAEAYLLKTGYHRLSLYWSQYQPGLPNDKNFVSNLTFQRITEVYEFDAGLRAILESGIAIFEPAFKARFGYAMLCHLGSEGYADYKNFKVSAQHQATCKAIRDDVEKSKEPAVVQLRESANDVPVWMAFEVASFGRISNLFGNVSNPKLMKDSSSPWGVNQAKLPGIVQGISLLRNTLAHHGRLWWRVSSVRGAPIDYPLFLKTAQMDVGTRTTYWWAAMLVHLVESCEPSSSFRAELNAYLGSNKTMWQGLGIPDTRNAGKLI